MPRRCVVIGCPANESILNKSLYRFPSGEELCKKWIKALCNLELMRLCETEGFKHLNKNKFVCSDHFENKCLRNVRAPNQGLFDGSIPSKNLYLNMDVLISHIKETDVLYQIMQPLSVQTKPRKQGSCTSVDVKGEEVSVSNIKVEKMGEDDIPLRELFGETKKMEDNNVKPKAKRKKKDGNSKESSISKFEEEFLPTKKKLRHFKTQKSEVDVKNEIDEVVTNNLNRKKVKLNRRMLKNKGVKRKDEKDIGNDEKLIEVVVAPKLIDREQFKLSTQGPKKIIKVVIPQKGGDGNTENQAQNKIIKVVVPKKTANGKEIHLEKEEVNKILRLVSASRRINSNGVGMVNRSSENSDVLKIMSVPKNLDNLEKMGDVVRPKSCDGNGLQMTRSNNKILKKVSPPKDIHEKAIKLIAVGRDNDRVRKKDDLGVSRVEPQINLVNEEVSLVDDTKTQNSTDVEVPENVGANIKAIESLVPEAGVGIPCTAVEIVSEATTDGCVKESIDKYDSVDKSRQSEIIDKSRQTEIMDKSKQSEISPATEELCKRIKSIIGQRLGENTNMSDSEDDRPLKPKNNVVDNKRKCSCNSECHDKIVSLWQEEKELRRRLLMTQNVAHKQKMNNKKLVATIAELRKQIPEKRASKSNHVIKTIVPVNKVREKNPRKYRFTKNFKSFALDLFYSSPLSYSILEKIYFLPSRKTLKNWLVHPKNGENNFITIEDKCETVRPDNNSEPILVDNYNQSDFEYSEGYPQPVHHQHIHVEIVDSSMEANIEPLLENLDDIMFQTDIAAAILNT